MLGGVPLPPGYEVFQVPTSFQGIPVVTQDFVDRAHGDGYAVHVWTIDDVETMNELWDYGVDGIMSAEPMRLEHNMCQRDEPRPPLPKSSPGEHCAKNVSIACEVKVKNVKRTGHRKAKVTLARKDDFDSRCAGKVTLKAIGANVRKKAKFNFGWHSPEAGGPSAGRRQGQAQRGPPGIDRAPREGPGADASVWGVRGAVDEGRVDRPAHNPEVVGANPTTDWISLTHGLRRGVRRCISRGATAVRSRQVAAGGA